MTILVDMDEVMESLAKSWAAAVNAKYGYDVDPETIDEWDFAKFFPGLSRNQVYRIMDEDDFWQTVEPLPGAAETLQKLMEDGHDVYVVTTTHPRCLWNKVQYCLNVNFPFINLKHLIVTGNKQMIRGDVLIDDNPDNLTGGEYVQLLMTAPHNRSFDAEAHGMTRVNNWDEIYDMICFIERNKCCGTGCIGVRTRENNRKKNSK